MRTETECHEVFLPVLNIYFIRKIRYILYHEKISSVVEWLACKQKGLGSIPGRSSRFFNYITSLNTNCEGKCQTFSKIWNWRQSWELYYWLGEEWHHWGGFVYILWCSYRWRIKHYIGADWLLIPFLERRLHLRL